MSTDFTDLKNTSSIALVEASIAAISNNPRPGKYSWSRTEYAGSIQTAKGSGRRTWDLGAYRSRGSRQVPVWFVICEMIQYAMRVMDSVPRIVMFGGGESHVYIWEALARDYLIIALSFNWL